MVDGSYDIPALKFFICVMDDYYFKYLQQNDWKNFDGNNCKLFEFEQADGLTLNQFYSIFCNGDRSKRLTLLAVIDRNPLYVEIPPQITVVSRFNLGEISDEEFYDKEISCSFEIALLNISSLDNSPTTVVEDFKIIATFCTRYRGRKAASIDRYLRSRAKDTEYTVTADENN